MRALLLACWCCGSGRVGGRHECRCPLAGSGGWADDMSVAVPPFGMVVGLGPLAGPVPLRMGKLGRNPFAN